VVFVSVVKDFSDVTANAQYILAQTKISDRHWILMLSIAAQQTKLTSSAVDVETVFVVNAIATCAGIPKNSSVDNFASATTSHAIVTIQFFVLDLIMVSASAENANVTSDGAEMLATLQTKQLKFQVFHTLFFSHLNTNKLFLELWKI
jgi:hypothetical protein